MDVGNINNRYQLQTAVDLFGVLPTLHQKQINRKHKDFSLVYM